MRERDLRRGRGRGRAGATTSRRSGAGSRPVVCAHAGEVVEHDVEPQPRRDAVDRRVPHRHGREAVAVELRAAPPRRAPSTPRTASAAGAARPRRASVVRPRRAVHRARGREDESPDTRLLRRARERDRAVEVDVVRQLGVEVADRVVRQRREMHDRVEALEVAGASRRARPRSSAAPPRGRARSRSPVVARVEPDDVVARAGDDRARAPSRCSRGAGDENPHEPAFDPARAQLAARRTPRRSRSAQRHSMPRSRISPRNISSSNQCLPALASGSAGEQRRASRSTTSSLERDVDVRRPRSPSHFGISYSRIEVVAERVPRQLAGEPVILVEVVARVREDEVGLDALSSSNASFTASPWYGMYASRKPWTSTSTRGGAREERLGARARLGLALALAPQHDPVTSTPGCARVSARSVPPQPISMSSAWQPIASTRRSGARRRRARGRASGGPRLVVLAEPDLAPRRAARLVQRLEALPVLDRVHRPEEALVRVRDRPRRAGSASRTSPRRARRPARSSRAARAGSTKKPPLIRTSDALMSSTDVTIPSSSVIDSMCALNCGRTDRNWISFPDARNASSIRSRGASVSPSPYVAKNSSSSLEVLLDRLETLADRRLHARCRRT